MQPFIKSLALGLLTTAMCCAGRAGGATDASGAMVVNAGQPSCQIESNVCVLTGDPRTNHCCTLSGLVFNETQYCAIPASDGLLATTLYCEVRPNELTCWPQNQAAACYRKPLGDGGHLLFIDNEWPLPVVTKLGLSACQPGTMEDFFQANPSGPRACP